MLLSEITLTPALTVDSEMLHENSEQLIAQMKAVSINEIPVLSQGKWGGVFRLYSQSFPREKEVAVWIKEAPCYQGDTKIRNIEITTNSSLVGVVDHNDYFIGVVHIDEIVGQQKIIWDHYMEVLDKSIHLDAVIESAYDGVLISNGEGIVTRVNPAMCKFSGMNEASFIGRHLNELVHLGVFKEDSVTLIALKEKREAVGLQRYPTGPEHLVCAVPMIDELGRLQGAVATVRDTTELTRMKEELNFFQKRTEQYQLELLKLRKQVFSEEIIAVSPKIVQAFELAGRVANFDSTVLVLGDSGVGKEVIANYIHKHSRRSTEPFLKINCGALPPDLLESELFGYDAGAFTGANRTGKKGLFESADGGTIFLDEIGEMSLSLQVKVLRVLQEQEFTRVGGVEPIQVNCRIIAATHRDLKELIKKGLFREDLFYRLYVVPIYVPPLRERQEDIPAMIHYFLKRYNQKHGLKKVIEPEVIMKLQKYEWPGNVRQLSNLIERLIVTVLEDTIDIYHLPEDVLEGLNRSLSSHGDQLLKPKGQERIEVSQVDTQMTETNNSDQFNAFNVMERDLIIESLSRYGSIRKVGRALGVSHTTVIKKMKKYGIKK